MHSSLPSPGGTIHNIRYPPPPPTTRDPETFFVRLTTPEENRACRYALKHLQISSNIQRNPDQLSVSWYRKRSCGSKLCLFRRLPVPPRDLFPTLQIAHKLNCNLEGRKDIQYSHCCSYDLSEVSSRLGDKPLPVSKYIKRKQRALPQWVYDEVAWRHGIYQGFVARQPFIGFTQPKSRYSMCFTVICPYLVSPFHCQEGDRNLVEEADGQEGTPCLAMFTSPEFGKSEVDLLRSYFAHVDHYHTTGEFIDQEPHKVIEPQYYRRRINILNTEEFYGNVFIPLDLNQFRQTLCSLALDCQRSMLQERLDFLFDKDVQVYFDVALTTKRIRDLYEASGVDWMLQGPGTLPGNKFFPSNGPYDLCVCFTVGDERSTVPQRQDQAVGAGPPRDQGHQDQVVQADPRAVNHDAHGFDLLNELGLQLLAEESEKNQDTDLVMEDGDQGVQQLDNDEDNEDDQAVNPKAFADAMDVIYDVFAHVPKPAMR